MFEKIHEKVKKEFKVTDWEERLKKSKALRGTWETLAEKLLRMKRNIIIEGTDHELNDVYNKYFNHNIMWKQLRWLLSYLFASKVTFHNVSHSSLNNTNVEVLQNELNDLLNKVNLYEPIKNMKHDRLWLGLGYVKVTWDKYDIDDIYQQGKPKIEYVPARNVYLDHTSRAIDKSDMRHIFHIDKYNYQSIKNKYPEHTKDIDYNKKDDDTVEIVTVQFMNDELLDCVRIDDYSNDELTSVHALKEDYEKMPADLDEVEINDVKKRVNFWYEAKYIKNTETIIQKPIYVGEKCSYLVSAYEQGEDNPYCNGLAFYLKDLQEIHTINNTMLTLEVLEYQKPKLMKVEGAVVDDKDFVKNWKKQGYITNITKQHAKEIGADKALFYLPKPQYPAERLALNVNTEHSVRDMTGVTQTNEGQANSAVQSGTQASLLQNAGRIYLNCEEVALKEVYKKVAEMIMDFIVKYMDYPHYVRIINYEGEPEMMLINDPYYSEVRYDRERTFIEPQFIESLMVEKQIQFNSKLALFDRGLADDLSVISSTDEPNPIKARDNARYYHGTIAAFQEQQAEEAAMEQAVKQKEMAAAVSDIVDSG